MSSDEKLCEALKAINDDLNENISNHQDIETIEAENKKLREKKLELIVTLSRPSPAISSIVLVKDIQQRQKNLNLFRFESKESSAARFKDRALDAHSETSALKEKLNGDDSLMTLPYNDVLNRINEFKDKTAEQRSAIEDLTNQHPDLVRNEQTDVDEAEDIRFIETLKILVEEQRQLIERLRGSAP